MQKFMETVIHAVQTWTDDKIKKSKKQLDDRISNSAADWNQNDSCADNYVKNRTHWEEVKKTILVNNLTFADYNDGNFPKCNFVPEQKYNIIWNGVLYSNLICWFDGNYNIIASQDMGCPFYINDDGGDGLYIESDDDNNWVVSIIEVATVVHKLDQKYLSIPANLATTDDIQEAIDVANNARNTADAAQAAADSKMDKNNPVGTGSFSMNRKAGSSLGDYSHAEGFDTTASGKYSHAEGYKTAATTDNMSPQSVPTTQFFNLPYGSYGHAEGYGTVAYGGISHAEGNGTTAFGRISHAEGHQSISNGTASHAEGFCTNAEGYASHAEGRSSETSAEAAHAEGNHTTASGDASHAEGIYTTASGHASHAEGDHTTASTLYSHAEGAYTTASNQCSHAEGAHTTASGPYSHAEGCGTTASSISQHTEGQYNIVDYIKNDFERGKYLHIVGNGTSTTNRSNAHTLDWNGVGWYQGGLQVGGNAQDDGAKNVLLEGDAIPVPETASIGQTLAVKSVDESGKPTEWEAVDAPTGDGSGAGIVVSETAPEDTSVLWVDTSDNETDNPQRFVKTVNGKAPDENGNVVIEAGGGTEDYSALNNKPSINGVTLDGNKTAADLGIGNPTAEQIANAVDSWLDAHPEAVTTVADGSITPEKLADGAVILSKLSESATDEHYFDPYLRVQYTVGMLNADGTIDTSKTARVTEFLPVVPGETIWLNGGLTNAVAYYDKAKTFISKSSISSGLSPYTVPSGAYYAIYQNAYSGGYPPFFNVRKKATPKNECFSDLVLSPIKSVVSIGVTGDSNTKGYGLAAGESSWAELMMAELEKTNSIRVLCHSRFAEVLGAYVYGDGLNYKAGSQISVWTDATSIELKGGTNYSSAFTWYKNDVEIEGSSGLFSMELDGEFSKITVKFTGGQYTDAYFVIPKTITHTNTAVTGVGAQNVTIPQGHDWLLVMIGTNDRTALTKAFFNNGVYQYSGKGTYIVPFPNHKEDASDTITQAHRFNEYRRAMTDCGYEVVDCSDVNAWAFYDNALYQGDLIHFNAKGHRIMCNMISGKLGVPVMLNGT